MIETVSISVSGMKCGGCEATVNKTLSAITGVASVKASHTEKKVDVEYDPDVTDLDILEDAITDAGFFVE